MDAETVLALRPALTEYLHTFDGCFGRCTARQHLDTYVAGQLGPLPRKSVEPMADAAGVPPRNLQQLLSLYRWDEAQMRDLLQQRIAARHSHRHSVGILDETSFAKKGVKTAGVQRQHCGATGKTDNCVVSVHLGYATPEFHTLVDGELYLPEKTWHEDRERCRAAGVPDQVVYRPKWQIGLGQLERARRNGLFCAWLTFDEGYGGKPPFLRELDRAGQKYVGEVPASFAVWTIRPDVLYQAPGHPRPGRARKFPRLKRKSNPKVEVRHVARHSPLFRQEPWQSYHLRDASKGPMVWKAKRLRVWLEDEQGLPTRPYHLLVACNVLEPEQLKYFISNAPEDTPVTTLLLVAFSRWKIERMFEDGKSELGLDHFEVRQFGSIQRHLILSCVSYLFLAEFLQARRGEKPGPDALPGADGNGDAGRAVGAGRPLFTPPGRSTRTAFDPDPAAQRPGPTQPPQTHLAPPAPAWDTSERPDPLQLEALVAL